MHDDQDLAAQDGFLQACRGIDGHPNADQCASNGTVPVARRLHVLPEVTCTQYATEARYRHGLHFAEPIDELLQAATLDRYVLQAFGGASILLHRVGITRRASDHADGLWGNPSRFEGAYRLARLLIRGEEARHRQARSSYPVFPRGVPSGRVRSLART